MRMSCGPVSQDRGQVLVNQFSANALILEVNHSPADNSVGSPTC